jgi:predicted nuclease with TOPRIM domain
MTISLIDYWREITIAVGGCATFFAGLKSSKLLEKTQKINAIDAMQKTYDVFLQHYKTQMNELLDRMAEIELRNAVLMEEAESWKKRYEDLELKYRKLEDKLKDYEKKNKLFILNGQSNENNKNRN